MYDKEIQIKAESEWRLSFATWLNKQMDELDLNPSRLAKVANLHPNSVRQCSYGTVMPQAYTVYCIRQAIKRIRAERNEHKE